MILTKIAGEMCTEMLLNNASELTEYLNGSSSTKEIVREVKEKVSYVALDYSSEIAKYAESTVHDKIY